MTNHLELKRRIQEARKSYYDDGTSLLTDEEYDALEEELRLIDPDNELLKQVGAEPVSEFQKVKHEISMGSLNKVQNKEQWDKWVDKLPIDFSNPDHGHTMLMASEKLDGISIAVEFYNGSIVKAITHGDGKTGEDIVSNVRKMKGMRQGCTYKPYTGWLRGEIILLKSDWQKYHSDMKTARNAAAGIAKRLSSKDSEHLSVKFYYATPTKYENWTYKSEMWCFIRNQLKFDTPAILDIVTDGKISSLVKKWEENREGIDYDIDGIVVEINDIKVFDDMGETDSRPKGAIAYKFPPKQKTTKVKSITWQIGRTGRVTPVAELEPINIDGITIGRVSLHTARIALDSKAGPGATVMIQRANDVIPYMSKVLVEVPIEDPVTHPIKELGKVRWDGEYLVVDQMEDRTILYNSIKTWVQRLRILHWGDSFVNILMGYELVKSLPDIYRLDWDLVAQFAGDGIAKRARKSLERSGNNIDFTSFISALNIRFCDSLAKNLVEAMIDTPKKLLATNMIQLSSIEGIGKIKAEAIRRSITQLAPTIVELDKIINFEKKSGSLVGKSFIFTGSMNHQRKELESMVLNNGGEVKKSVTKGLTYLIMADPNSGTVKAQKAQKLGITCISEDEFLEICDG